MTADRRTRLHFSLPPPTHSLIHTHPHTHSPTHSSTHTLTHPPKPSIHPMMMHILKGLQFHRPVSCALVIFHQAETLILHAIWVGGGERNNVYAQPVPTPAGTEVSGRHTHPLVMRAISSGGTRGTLLERSTTREQLETVDREDIVGHNRPIYAFAYICLSTKKNVYCVVFICQCQIVCPTPCCLWDGCVITWAPSASFS